MAQLGPHDTVHVLDNDSPDDSFATARRAITDERVSWTTSDENLGFGRGMNRLARSAEGPLLLLLNPDAELHDGTLEALRSAAVAHPSARVWGGAARDADGVFVDGSFWGVPTPWSVTMFGFGLTSLLSSRSWSNPESMPHLDRRRPQEVGFVSGACLMIERSLWEELDGFDERFFMYGEDADLGMRARSLGARPRYEPTAGYFHAFGGSSASTARRIPMLLRGKVSLMDKHWSRPAAWWGRFCLALGVHLRSLTNATWRPARAQMSQWQQGWPPS